MNKFFTKAQKFLYDGLNDHKSKQFGSFNLIISIATVISILSIILESVAELQQLSSIFLLVEQITIAIFVVEYITRIITAPKKLTYILSFWGIIDLISILPSFIGIAGVDYLESLRMLRIIRFVRVLRLIKISRIYLNSTSGEENEKSLVRMNITIYLLALFSISVIFGSILHVIESSQYAYSNIPLAMLQVLTMLVGGAFVTAITIAGEIIIVIIKFIGLALFGLLINIVTELLKKWLLGNKIENVTQL